MKSVLHFDSHLENSRVSSVVKTTRKLKKYFKSNKMFVIYDSDIEKNKSIYNIPIIANVLPLAWLSNSDVNVDELDINFKKSMDLLKKTFSKIYKTEFDTVIEADKLVYNNDINLNLDEKHALLFSGGVDSTYSLLTNFQLKPRLVMTWGLESHPYPVYSDYWERVISIYSDFARRKGIKYHIIKTNALEILHERRIEHDFHKELMEGTLWARIQHSLVLIPLLAPLSIGRFDNILFSATHPSTHNYEEEPYASQPVIDENIKWANISVKHVGAIHRYDKITKVIANYLKNDKLMLRCCMDHKNVGNKLNCGIDPHCFTVIPSLVQSGIDPNTCGFDLDESTFIILKNNLKKRGFSEGGIEYIWGKIYDNIPDRIDNDLYGSKEFFKWFKTLDLTKEIEKNNENYSKIYRARKLYNRIPWLMAKILDEIYKKIGIQIHEATPRQIDD